MRTTSPIFARSKSTQMTNNATTTTGSARQHSSNSDKKVSKINVGPYLHAIQDLELERRALHRQILEVIRFSCTDGWAHAAWEQVTVDHLSGAMTNLVFIVSKPYGLNAKVLVRVYGEGTDLFFRRDQEMKLFKILSEHNVGIKCLGEFENGRVEKHIDGHTCTYEKMRMPAISALIAAKMSRLHTLEIECLEKKAHVMDKVREFVLKIKEHCVGTAFESLDVAQIEADVRDLDALLATTASPLVFSHSDLQYGNIMLTEDDAVLIDYEYSDYNPRGFDIGNHFCEWAFNYSGGQDVPAHMGDFTKYPSVQEQRHFCKHYLQAQPKPKHQQGQWPTEDMIEQLRHEANTYAQASHLFWALWGFIQATQSEIDFDFVGYANCRLNAFRQRIGLSLE